MFAEARHDSSRLRLQRGARSIVIVDDSEDLAASVAALLELEGYSAYFALTGAAGMDLVMRSRASAVLLDYMLPDMTGADVATALRADPTTRRVHIVMCTGTPEVTVRQRFTDYQLPHQARRARGPDAVIGSGLRAALVGVLCFPGRSAGTADARCDAAERS
jgi:CheY-like chemotaxis protein